MNAANPGLGSAISSGTASIASFGNDSTYASVGTQRVLEYPRDFFNSNGNVWENPLDISRFWCYRKDRRDNTLLNGNADPERCDHVKMRAEMLDIRKSLRNFIMQSYLEGVRKAVRNHDGLRMPHTLIHPITEADMKLVLGQLDRTPENEVMVFRAFQEFHKNRSWLATEIDIWLAKENMQLMEGSKGLHEASGKKIKEFRYYCGSFSRVAGNAKGQGVAAMMDYMLAKAGWCVAMHKKECKAKH